MSVTMGCLKFLKLHRFSNAALDELSTTITSVTTIDAKGREGEQFKKNYHTHMNSFKILNRFMNNRI